ncbi:signal peptidase I [Laceyella sacchari]|jgi:signal peptidase I|uniref:Signal peptidase I n=1 Tax=Laceyella sacchari TaxID=37482 RepID=A0ABY5U263_LACSH|nr:signal peptidase I [Laceyella sacchari]TCW36566.1 type I signal peptidase [Laceyella sacchari]UWE03751.1 signal peptidase I [Laceyella sacchari]
MIKKSSSAVRSTFEWVGTIAVSLVIAGIIRVFLFSPYDVHGASMEPTLMNDEKIIVNKWSYRMHEPVYGDIVVFHAEEGRDFIKRVIGLPGDRIEIKNGKVYRNGKMLNEPYIQGMTYTRDDARTIVVPKGSLYVLGDNRENSRDSRDLGAIPLSRVVGRADVVVLPIKHTKVLTGQEPVGSR